MTENMQTPDPAVDLLQPLPVEGYKPQPKSNVEMVNFNKKLEELVLRQIDYLASLPPHEVDPRWLSIARTNIEQGFMAANRAVFQPKRIVGQLH